MKKKNLKKKIKKLEIVIERIIRCQRDLALKETNNANHIKSCKDATTKLETLIADVDASLTKRIEKLENDNKYYKEWMDRSGVDYKSWFNLEEKTCDTCKWKPLMEQGSPDLPCYGCTDTDKKMWKSKD